MKKENLNYTPSIYDDLYYELTGKYLAKEGTAYEKITAAVIGILTSKGVVHDTKIRGLSGTLYQIDGLVDQIIMIEAKDYQKRNSKVPRSDLQKQEGALSDLPNIDKGFFASATSFTKPALQYAKGSTTNPMQKPILPFNIRKSIDEDKKNRIETIEVQIDCMWPEFRSNEFKIIFPNDDIEEKLKTACMNSKEPLRIDTLYDSDGCFLKTIVDLTKEQQPKITEGEQVIHGEFSINAYIKFQSNLYKISGISYVADVVHLLDDFEVKKEGDAIILAKCSDLNIDKLITDNELKRALRCL